MKLTITSLEWIVRNEDVKQITVDTVNGQITILPGHDNLISVLKPWIIRLIPAETKSDRKFSFIADREFIVFWVLGGVCKIEANEVQILTNMVLLDNTNPVELLQEMKASATKKLHDAAQQKNWSSDEFDLEVQIQKIDVEMKLAMRKSR
jgi:F0F1-type ATP synthase epsilon subunit